MNIDITEIIMILLAIVKIEFLNLYLRNYSVSTDKEE